MTTEQYRLSDKRDFETYTKTFESKHLIALADTIETFIEQGVHPLVAFKIATITLTKVIVAIAIARQVPLSRDTTVGVFRSGLNNAFSRGLLNPDMVPDHRQPTRLPRRDLFG